MLPPFACVFTRPGYRRFAARITALASNVEEPTATRAAVAIERTAAGRAMERSGEYAARHPAAGTRRLTRPVEGSPGRTWHGYHVSAVDGTEVHRSGAHARGTRTSHESTARRPDRATTARAHNGVILGALPDDGDRPGWLLPISGRPYFRESQLPTRTGAAGPKGASRTECELATGLIRERARLVGGRHPAAFDGGHAPTSAIRPLIAPEDGSRRVEFPTRRRHDARRHARPPEGRRPGPRGPTPKWGKELPPPRRGGWWTRGGQPGQASIDGRRREVPWEEAVCLWRVAGPEVPVKAAVARVGGSTQRFAPVTSAVELTGPQAVELFAARSRQEDGFRDPKPRLGWEECRAWTRDPIERASRARWVTTSPLRLLQSRPGAEGRPDRWSPPPRNGTRERPSVLDVERLLRRHGPGIRGLLAEWLGDGGEAA